MFCSLHFFGLKKWNTSKSEARKRRKKKTQWLHIFETDSLESIEYKEASGEEMSFVKEDDTWEYAPDTTIALTESSMQNMEDAFSDIRAVKEIKNPDDLSDYGFDLPDYNLTLTGKDGEAHKFLIGNASGENYYFMEDGTEIPISRDRKNMESVQRLCAAKLKIGFYGVSPEECKNIWVAYEPVWSIGVNGTPASADYAEAMHKEIKTALYEIFGEKSEEIPVLYGGSVNPGNAESLIVQPSIDGLFVGRAAWDADKFDTLIRDA